MYVLLQHDCNKQSTLYWIQMGCSHFSQGVHMENKLIFQSHQPLTTTKSPALDIVFGQETWGCISPQSKPACID